MDVHAPNDLSVLLFPPLEKGGRGDLLLPFAEGKQRQIPQLIDA